MLSMAHDLYILNGTFKTACMVGKSRCLLKRTCERHAYAFCHQYARLRSAKPFLRVIEPSVRITLAQFYYAKPLSRSLLYIYISLKRDLLR